MPVRKPAAIWADVWVSGPYFAPPESGRLIHWDESGGQHGNIFRPDCPRGQSGRWTRPGTGLWTGRKPAI